MKTRGLCRVIAMSEHNRSLVMMPVPKYGSDEIAETVLDQGSLSDEKIRHICRIGDYVKKHSGFFTSNYP